MELAGGDVTFGLETHEPNGRGGSETRLSVYDEKGALLMAGSTRGGLNFQWQGRPHQGPVNIVPGVVDPSAGVW